jgi:hypothetical protein
MSTTPIASLTKQAAKRDKKGTDQQVSQFNAYNGGLNMRHGIRSSIISLIAGFVALIVYVWVRASPEFSYFTWLSFYLAIASGLLSAHLVRIRLAAYLVFLPLFGWHLCWLLFHASNGNLNTLSLTHLLVIITISTAIYFATKRRTRRRVSPQTSQ